MSSTPSPIDYVLGVDLGTSSCKAIAFTLDGRRLAASSAGYPTLVDLSGGVRQDPESWWSAVRRSIKETLASVNGGRLTGIGLSAQIGTHVLVDEGMVPIAKAWTWQDGGAASSLPLLAASIDAGSLAAELQTWLPPGPAWPLPRMLWLRDSAPALFERARYILQPKDLVLHRLTGVLMSDASSWRGLVKPGGELHRPALDRLGLPHILPPIASPTTEAGAVLPMVAEDLGIDVGTPVFVGWNDFSSALIGTGIGSAGDAFDIAGTSEHLGVLGSVPVTDGSINSVPYTVAAGPASFVNYGVTSNGGSVTAWLGSTYLDAIPAGAPRNARIAELASTVAPGVDGLVFLPYLHGERSPVWDGAATATYSGLRSTHQLAHLVRAGLEGVAFNLRQIRDASPDHTRIATAIRASGGPMGMRLWNEIKADVLGVPLFVMEEKNAAALGAAMLAGIGLGRFAGAAEAIAGMTRIEYTVEPDRENKSVYDEAYGRFIKLYPALTPGYAARNRSTKYAS